MICFIRNRSPYELRIQVYKKVTNIILDWNGDPRYLCMYDLFGGGLYLISWYIIPMVSTLLINSPLIPPLTSSSLFYINYGKLFTTIIHNRVLQAPRRNVVDVFSIKIIFVIPLHTLSLYMTKLSWPDTPYSHNIIPSQ